MTARLERNEFTALAPKVYEALQSLSKAISENGLDLRLIELVKLRASQINGCAFCIQFHAVAARKLGIDSDQVQLLSAWQEVPLFSERERAALLWTELLTILDGVADEAYAEVRRHFTDAEVAHLTAAVALINAWNRIAIAYRFSPLLSAPTNVGASA